MMWVYVQGVEAILMSGRRSWLTVIALLFIITAVITPSLAYRENQFELRSGNLLFQSQLYKTTPTQALFHSQSVAGTDAENFAFSPVAGGGYDLAQSSSGDVVATDTGFFTATFSFLKFNCPTGEGFLHTDIGDSLVSRTPVFSGLEFPDMIKSNNMINTVGSATPAIVSPGTSKTIANNSAGQATASMPAINGTGNVAAGSITTMEPLINKEVSTQVGVEDTTNILAVRPTPAPQPVPTFTGTATGATATASPTPSYATVPKASTLLTKPLSRQSNKPFTDALDPDYNPRTATRSEVRNISGWDRLTTNVIGRSGIDSTYQNQTSSPTYINPWNSIKLANKYQVMADSKNMTHAGSYLQQRLWAL
jgi:hypothetical protein